MKITSLQNDKVKYWVSLGEKKNRDQSQVFLVEGDHLICEAEKMGMVVEKISTYDESADYLVTDAIMKKISKQQSISKNAAVVRFLQPDSISGNVLVLDGIQDPGNLGTILRSAVAFSFRTIILGDNCVDVYNPKVVRATEGMLFSCNVLRKNLLTFLPELKEKGYVIVGTAVVNGIDVQSLATKNIALVIGSEGKGLSVDVKQLCDQFVYIPMHESCESLNAGVAASILMYEIYHKNMK